MSVHYSSQRLDWKTPKAVYQVLDAEFRFEHDPCPTNPTADGLTSEWGGRTLSIRRMAENYLNGSPKATRSGRKARLSCFLFLAVPILAGGTTTA